MARGKGDLVRSPRLDTARARAWTIMRAFGQRRETFVVEDLCVRASSEFGQALDPTNLQRYARALSRSGHLDAERLVKGKRRLWRYRMARDTGPVPPVMRDHRKAVYDPNTGCEHSFGEMADA